MSKLCVFITGTNGVGKSTLARALQEYYGGIKRTEKNVSYCENGVAFAGKYSTKYGGVDTIRCKKGSCTWMLAEVVEEALRYANIVFCEGSNLHTFGLNLTNAMFKADQYLVIPLFTDARTIYERLEARNNGRATGRKFDLIIQKQNCVIRSAKKWASIGVPLLPFDTSKISPNEMVAQIVKKCTDLVRE